MISVLTIGSLYWSVSASYQQRDGVQQCTTTELTDGQCEDDLWNLLKFAHWKSFEECALCSLLSTRDSDSSSFRYLTPAQESPLCPKMVKIPFARFSYRLFCILFYHRVPVFVEKILICCRGWCRWLVFLARDVSSTACRKIPFHVKLLPRGTLANLIFKLHNKYEHKSEKLASNQIWVSRM